MSDSHHRPRHRTDHERKEGTKDDYEAPEWNWRRNANKLAFNVLEIAAGRRSIFGQLKIPQRPSRDRKRRHERDQHRLHEHDRRHRRRTNSTSRGRHRSPNRSRRGQSDVPNNPWSHGHPPDISKPTEPTSSRSRARSPTFVESDEDLDDIRADAPDIQHTGSDHVITISHLVDDHHGLSRAVEPDPSDSGDGYDSNVSKASSCLDTNHKTDIDNAISSNPVDGRDIDVNKPLSGSEPDNNNDLAVNAPSDREEKLTASPRNIPPHSHELPTEALKFGTVDVADDPYDGLPAEALPDASSGPPDSGGSYGSNPDRAVSGLEIDQKENLDDAAMSDSNENVTIDSDQDSVDQVDTPLTSHETSYRDDAEGGDSKSRTSNSSEDQEENHCQATTSLSQVAKTDLPDAFPKSGENRAAPLGSGPLHSSEDHQAEDILNVVARLQHTADTDRGDASSESEDAPSESKDISSNSEGTSSGSKDKDSATATGDSDGSIDASSEKEEEVDDALGQDEGSTHIPPQPSPEKREKASTIAPVGLVDSAGPADPVVPSPPQGNVAGSEDPEPEVSPSHSPPETEGLGPPQPPPSALPVYLYPGSIVRRRSKDDHHPYIIIRIEQDENGKTILWACLCTSRPQLKKIRDQYGKLDGVIHFIYLGGKEPNPKGFETGDIKMPTEPELEIHGPKMPFYTYLELDEYGPFEPGDFKALSGGQRHLTPSSLDEVLNQCSQHGCKKSPPGSVPARATGNTHERIFT